MPLQKLSGEDAIHNIRSNASGTWPSRNEPDLNRIEPLCRPQFQPSFKLQHGEKIFTIGSCFARNIERELMARGFDVVTSALEWPDKVPGGLGNGVLNNYGVASIANELRWALDPEHPFDPAQHVVQLAPSRYTDLHISLPRPAAIERVTAYRKAITDVTRRVKECRVVIMTLGLSELWYDTRSGSYLNVTPQRGVVLKNPGRFELHLLDFAETMQHLQAALHLLKTHCRPDLKILLTVSPVPLHATHTDRDVLVVNSYSKSVLRAAAEHVSAADPNIDYFPSYESVIMSERQLAWYDDQVHVNADLVQLNVQRMVDAYKPDAVAVDQEQIQLRVEQAEAEFQARRFVPAIRLLEPLVDAAKDQPRFATLYVEICLKLDRTRDARTVIAGLPSDSGDFRGQMLEAMVFIAEDETEKGISILEHLREANPRNVAVLRALTDAYQHCGRWNDALAVAHRWAKVTPFANGPAAKIAAIHRARGDFEAADRAYSRACEHKGANTYQRLEYVEFLIEQRRLEDAATALQSIAPETPALLQRCEQLRLLLPTAKPEPALAAQ